MILIRLTVKLLRLSAFVLGVLVMGQLINWDGRSLSDHIKSHMGQTGRSSERAARELSRSTDQKLAEIKAGANQAASVAKESLGQAIHQVRQKARAELRKRKVLDAKEANTQAHANRDINPARLKAEDVQAREREELRALINQER